MKKLTFLLLALVACAFVMNADEPEKVPMRSAIFSSLPSGFEQVGETSLYYDVDYRYAVGPGYQYGFSILGEIDGLYYSSTYESGGSTSPGAGFIAAFKVNDGTATYLNALEGTTRDGVTMTASTPMKIVNVW